MNKFKKLLQCIKYKNVILGRVGINNRFESGARVESTTIIGNNNYFSFRVMCGNARIGNYCSFGPDVKIGQSKHSIDYFTTSQMISSKTIGFNLVHEPAIIGNDVWIGANAVIMQGVKIGDGVVIGANAVVTRDVPDYAIVAGVPAKLIRYRLPEKIAKVVKKSHWWDYDVKNACRILQEIEDSRAITSENKI